MTDEKCKDCFNSRPIISENGVHFLCGLSQKAAMKCMSGKKDVFKNIYREVKDNG